MSPSIDPRDALPPDELDALDRVFREQLIACLEECALGQSGLFAEAISEENAWPEARRLRELAIALQSVYAMHEQRNALCDEFLDLCSISAGEANMSGRRLARAFLERIEKGEVGTPTESEKKPW